MKNNTGLILFYVVLVSLNVSTVLSLMKVSEFKNNTNSHIQPHLTANQSNFIQKFPRNPPGQNHTTLIPKAKKNKTKQIDPKVKAQKEAEKEKRMSKYFVRNLIKTLNFNDFLAKKCVEMAPQKSLSDALDLSYSISTRKLKIQELVRLKDTICSEMKNIPEKLKDKVTKNKVRQFIKSHME